MPEDYDAFGRRAGEDPLSGLGWTSGSAPGDAPSVEVDTSPAVEAAPTPVATASHPGPGGAGGRRVAWLVALLVLGGIGAGAWQLVGSVSDEVGRVADEVRRAIPDTPAPSVPEPAAEAPAAEAPEEKRPAQPRSLLERRAFARALRGLEADVPGRLRSLRIEAGRIDVMLHLRGGRLRNAQWHAGAQAAQVINTTPPGFPAIGLFRYSEIDPGAPARLIRAAQRRVGSRGGRVNYLVFSRFGETLQWGVYFTRGAIVIGDAGGRYLRRIS